MTLRPEERRTAWEYDRWLGGGSLSSIVMRLLLGRAGAYLFNTPVLEIARDVGLQPDHRVLDLGCGAGGVAAELAQRAGLVHAPIGVDVSRRVLHLARRKDKESPVELIAAGATRLPFRDESFHLVVSAHMFKHLEDDTLFRVLMDVNRVLKPGGIMLVWEFAPTGSMCLDRFHRRLLTRDVTTLHLRSFAQIAPYALYTGFKYVDRQQFRLPFLFPPIPRVAMMLQKGPEAVVH